jgi:hypothetical protein
MVSQHSFHDQWSYYLKKYHKVKTVLERQPHTATMGEVSIWVSSFRFLKRVLNRLQSKRPEEIATGGYSGGHTRASRALVDYLSNNR